MVHFLASLLLFGGLGAMPTQAHQIESALHYLGGELELSSTFSNGQPTQSAVVRLLNADGSAGQELGRTDQAGRLTLNFDTVQDGIVNLQIDGGPGHRDYLEMTVQAGHVSLDEVVSLPVSLLLLGLLVSVPRRKN